MKDIIAVRKDECHWPVAELDGQHLFCAEPVAHDGCSYCSVHRPLSVETRVLTIEEQPWMLNGYLLSRLHPGFRARDTTEELR